MQTIALARPSRSLAVAALLLLTGLAAGCGGSGEDPASAAPVLAATVTGAAPGATGTADPGVATPTGAPGSPAPRPAVTVRADSGVATDFPPTPAARGRCGGARTEIETGLRSEGVVTALEVTCARVKVTTALKRSAADLRSARRICSIVGNATSTHGIAAVRVVSADGTELATGTNSDDCRSTR